jgi:rhodanese-related sulfurtransferase
VRLMPAKRASRYGSSVAGARRCPTSNGRAGKSGVGHGLSADARTLHGIVPGSLHIPRTVLEWRVALDSPWRNPHLGGLDQRLILICDHGYSSILAARNLAARGFYRAGDVVGGFEAWRDAGLPIDPCPRRVGTVDGLPGMGPSE